MVYQRVRAGGDVWAITVDNVCTKRIASDTKLVIYDSADETFLDYEPELSRFFDWLFQSFQDANLPYKIFRISGHKKWKYMIVAEKDIIRYESSLELIQWVGRAAVGLPATYCIGSDRYATRIVEVNRNGREVVTDIIATFTYRSKRDMYIRKGGKCGILRLGVAEDYRDPSF